MLRTLGTLGTVETVGTLEAVRTLGTGGILRTVGILGPGNIRNAELSCISYNLLTASFGTIYTCTLRTNPKWLSGCMLPEYTCKCMYDRERSLWSVKANSCASRATYVHNIGTRYTSS